MDASLYSRQFIPCIEWRGKGCAVMRKQPFFMSQLRPGMTGEVVSLNNKGSMRHRLQDLGLVEGSRVTCLGKSIWGEPAAYEVCGAIVALRQADCRQVLLREISE